MRNNKTIRDGEVLQLIALSDELLKTVRQIEITIKKKLVRVNRKQIVYKTQNFKRND